MCKFNCLINRRDFLKAASIGGLTLLSMPYKHGGTLINLAAAADNGCFKTSILGRPHDTLPIKQGAAEIQEIGAFRFDPTQIETNRPDLFNKGYFSLFDILFHLAKEGKIDLKFHFDPKMDTHVIDDLNGSHNWWYQVWYSGGWRETSVHRMDYYPVKDKMHISFRKINPNDLKIRQDIWRTEVARQRTNNGKTIVSEVRIIDKDQSNVWTYRNVEITPHNLRPDFFVKDTLTAADVIMTLGDLGKISYQMLWYDNIGNAEINNYYVECINSSIHSGMCGFVYELGEATTLRGNHIHVTPDIRIIKSPKYVLFFWIKLGPCT